MSHRTAAIAGAAQRPRGGTTPAGVLQRKCACGGSAGPGGECEACRKKRLQRKAASQTETSGAVPSVVHDVLRSPGQPLDAATRSFFEPRFGHDFGRVRVHTDGRAASSADAVDALAYTVGNDVVFGKGAYDPRSERGLRLLAHELVHTIQQSQAGPSGGPLQIGDSAGPAEAEAERVSNAVAHTRTRIPVGSNVARRPRAIQRQPRSNEQNGGCGICTSAAVTGTFAHTTVQFMFGLTYGRRMIIPETPFFNPADQENGRLDLMRIIRSEAPPTIIEIGEIKPDNDQGRKAGKTDLEFYKDQVEKMFPAPMYKVMYMTLDPPQASVPFTDAPLSQCPFQELKVRGPKLGGQPGLYFYSCTPPRSKIDKSCCGSAVPVTVPSEAEEKSKEKSLAPATVPVLQPSMAKQIAQFVKSLINSGADIANAVDAFLRMHPEIVDYLYVAALSIFLANVIEDILTLGAGLADEPIVVSICLAMVRAARAMRAAALVPALAP